MSEWDRFARRRDKLFTLPDRIDVRVTGLAEGATVTLPKPFTLPPGTYDMKEVRRYLFDRTAPFPKPK